MDINSNSVIWTDRHLDCQLKWLDSLDSGQKNHQSDFTFSYIVYHSATRMFSQWKSQKCICGTMIKDYGSSCEANGRRLWQWSWWARWNPSENNLNDEKRMKVLIGQSMRKLRRQFCRQPKNLLIFWALRVERSFTAICSAETSACRSISACRKSVDRWPHMLQMEKGLHPFMPEIVLNELRKEEPVEKDCHILSTFLIPLWTWRLIKDMKKKNKTMSKTKKRNEETYPEKLKAKDKKQRIGEQLEKEPEELLYPARSNRWIIVWPWDMIGWEY